MQLGKMIGYEALRHFVHTGFSARSWNTWNDMLHIYIACFWSSHGTVPAWWGNNVFKPPVLFGYQEAWSM